MLCIRKFVALKKERRWIIMLGEIANITLVPFSISLIG